MDFEHNAERNAYLAATGKLILKACPGSGKTTSIAKKISSLVEFRSEKKSGIACITFTNSATDEILDKISQFGKKSLDFPNTVCTINSFINKYILFPNINKFLGTNKEYRIVDNKNEINSFIKRKYSKAIYIKLNNNLLHTIFPSSIEYNLDGSLYSSDTNDVHKDYFEIIKKIQLYEGMIKSTDSEFFSSQILNQNKRIAELLIRRFDHLIIDEAQDCSDIHFYIFDQLISAGLQNIEFVGDPYQGIYEFNNSNPEELDVRHKDTQNWIPLKFTSCRRSTQKIIDMYSFFNTSGDDIVSSACISPEKEVVIIQFDNNNIDALKDSFLSLSKEYSSKRILVRGETGLVNFGVYEDKKNIPWENESVADLISVKRFFDERNIKKAVDLFRRVYVELSHPDAKYADKRKFGDKILTDVQFNSKILKIIRVLPDTNLLMSDWTKRVEDLINANLTDLSITLNIKTATKGKFKNAAAKKVIDFFPVKSKNEIEVTNIHQAKGLTIEAVMVVLSARNTAKGIAPANIVTTSSFPDERQRMIYVAMSRASHLLVIAIPNTVDLSQHELLKDLRIKTC